MRMSASIPRNCLGFGMERRSTNTACSSMVANCRFERNFVRQAGWCAAHMQAPPLRPGRKPSPLSSCQAAPNAIPPLFLSCGPCRDRHKGISIRQRTVHRVELLVEQRRELFLQGRGATCGPHVADQGQAPMISGGGNVVWRLAPNPPRICSDLGERGGEEGKRGGDKEREEKRERGGGGADGKRGGGPGAGGRRA